MDVCRLGEGGKREGSESGEQGDGEKGKDEKERLLSLYIQAEDGMRSSA